MSGNFRIGDWSFTPDTGLLRRGHETRQLAPQQADLLRHLIERPGQVVSKDEVLETVWSGSIVEEGAVHRCVSEIRKALGDDAREPIYVRTLARRGYQWVAEVTELPGEPAADTAAGGQARGQLLPWALLAAGVVVLALGWWLHSLRQSQAIYEEAESVGGRPSIAVLDFHSAREGAGSDWLATAVPEMLATELAATPDFHVIPSDPVARLQTELSVRAAGGLSTATIRQARTRLGADYVVSGAITVLGSDAADELRVDLQVVRTAGGEQLGSFSETGTAADLFLIVQRCGARVLAILGSLPVGGREALAVTPYLPRDSDTLQLYFAGLRELRRYDAAAARELLEQSLEKEPGQPFALLALSQAHLDLGELARAAETAERALSLSRDLPREQRLWFETNQLAAAAKWDEAIARYQALRIFSPRNQEYALLLASAQNRAGRHEEAFATAESIRAEGSEDPRIDILLAESAALQGEHGRALELATAAEELGARIGATRVLIQALLLQGEAHYELGNVDEAFAVIAGARQSVAAAGDRRSAARILLTLARWQEDIGDFAESRQNLAEALSIFRALGDRAGEAKVMSLQALQAHDDGEVERGDGLFAAALDIFRETGNRLAEASALSRWATSKAFGQDYEGAGAVFEQALALYRELGNREMESMMLMNLGRVQLFSGEPSRAEGRFLAAERILRDLDIPGRLALVRYNLGSLHYEKGNLPEAREAFIEAERVFDEIANDRMRATSLEFLGVILAGQGELFQARARQEQALAMRREMGNAPRLAKSLLFTSDLALEAGDLEAAAGLAREAVDVSNGEALMVGEALMAVAHILALSGELTQAQEVLEQAKAALGEPEPLHDEAQRSLLIEATLHQARGEFSEALALVDRVLTLSQAGGSWATHARALLLSGKIEIAAGNRAAGEARLRRLAGEAADRGWTLFERKAQAALTAPDTG